MPANSAEHQFQRLADDVRQHVEPAAVGHADDDLVDARARPLLNDPVEQRDQRLSAFEGESLLPDETGVEELLEPLGLAELPEQIALLIARKLRPVEDRLHVLLKPVALAACRRCACIPRRSWSSRSLRSFSSRSRSVPSVGPRKPPSPTCWSR